MSPDHPAGSAARHPRRSTLLALALVLALGAGACASDGNGDRADTESVDPASNTDSDTDSSSNADSSDEAATDEGATDDAEAPDTGGEEAPGDVLGTARTQLPFSLDAAQLVPLRADVTRLERHDDLVELSITLTNESEPSAGMSFEAWRTFEDTQGGNYDISAVGLVDPAGQKIYLPAQDVEGNCLCTDGLDAHAAPPGEWILLNATIGGVPDEVEQVDVTIPGFPTIVGVTIQ
jgi:hypothetical protein